jgi:hypothetical protein
MQLGLMRRSWWLRVGAIMRWVRVRFGVRWVIRMAPNEWITIKWTWEFEYEEGITVKINK